MNPEAIRLKQHHTKEANWKNWGPYLSHRAWGTVREDYSLKGDAWDYFPYEHASSRVFRWNEDGLAGISDRNQYICFSLSLWNGKDTHLKERFFGLSNAQGNHGEDVKEYFFFLDSTPTHSYMKMLYKYPAHKFPYDQLIEENKKRNRLDPEFELIDTGIFNDSHYLDVFIEYAKVKEEDILIRFTVNNRSKNDISYWLLPTIWFRNTWSWGYPHGPMEDVFEKPCMQEVCLNESYKAIQIQHAGTGDYYLFAKGNPKVIFTENETNNQKLYATPNATPYVKDAFQNYLVEKNKNAINPNQKGTKAAFVYEQIISGESEQVFTLRLSNQKLEKPFFHFDQIFHQRIEEANLFYEQIQNKDLDEDEKKLQRQAFAGLLWNKQLYYYDVDQWLKGDPSHPEKHERINERNKEWDNLVNFDVISMPDKWEYPWYATWDLAFHCLPLVLIDPDFVKRQLELFTREWYMHPNGQLPAYEWNFSDVNPPVHAWAAWRTYKIDKKNTGKPDTKFLKEIFHKLLINFTWWINKKDVEGKNVFQGGFLGMDNISLFDRSAKLPFGGSIDQSDGTAWMGFYSIGMMKMALELSLNDPAYQDLATKFFEHFLRIATAMTQPMPNRKPLWDEEDGFFYDMLHTPDGNSQYVKVRSLVGLLPLFAVEILTDEMFEKMPVFARRVAWFLSKRPSLSKNMDCIYLEGASQRRMMSLVNRDMLASILSYMLDEKEFLSPYGIRSVSKYHEKNPCQILIDGQSFCVDYQPGNSQTDLFGGNSNWRGPIWFPINYLIIESLQKFHHYYGESFKAEFPTGSGNYLNLEEIARELSLRLIALFKKDENGKRAIFTNPLFQKDPHWKDLFLFHEFFHGETGEGLGACHQTGWTALVAKLLQQSGQYN
ncbi:Mannosyl oligosaccharide glucosidase [Candidatus Rubidus massiliensis]|nr:Mannosyl oligosaccharide glucosidase [Candidatus Rubidus massiliensis]